MNRQTFILQITSPVRREFQFHFSSTSPPLLHFSIYSMKISYSNLPPPLLHFNEDMIKQSTNYKYSMNSQRKKENVRQEVSALAAKAVQSNDPVWDKENELLQSDAEANSRLRQEITKESYADSMIQASIQDKITDLKDKAVHLAKNLENEKRKNVELEAIIRHISYIIHEEKKLEATHRNDMNFQSLDNLNRKIKKLQYDLDQIYSKSNDLNSKIKAKKNDVDVARTQRVIDSGIFLKIEKEIVSLETEYKKLLIEKTKYEKQYTKNLQIYKKMKADIEKEQILLSSRPSYQRRDSQQEHFFINAPEIQNANKFTQINCVESRKKNIGSKRFIQGVEAKKQKHMIEEQFITKKLFLETGLNNAEMLINHLENIDAINSSLFEEVNLASDKISALKDEIKKIESTKNNKKFKYYERMPELTKAEVKLKELEAIESEIRKIDKLSQDESKSLSNFLVTIEQLQTKKQLKQLTKEYNVPISEQEGLDAVDSIFGQLEIKLNPILQYYCQFQKKFESQSRTTAEIPKDCEPKEETIDDFMTKVKRIDESQKIMEKEEFKKQYEHLRRLNGNKRNGKKKTTNFRKGQMH